MIARTARRTIQSLIGVNYYLIYFREYHSTEDGEYIARCSSNPRDMMIAPNLHRTAPQRGSVRLAAGHRARMRNYKPDLPFKIELLVTGDEQQEFHEAWRLALSVLGNDHEFSQTCLASLAVVMLRFGSSNVVLEIWDDGQGFDVPKILKFLSLAQAFGMVGIQEVVEAVRVNFHALAPRMALVCAVISIKKAATQEVRKMIRSRFILQMTILL